MLQLQIDCLALYSCHCSTYDTLHALPALQATFAKLAVHASISSLWLLTAESGLYNMHVIHLLKHNCCMAECVRQAACCKVCTSAHLPDGQFSGGKAWEGPSACSLCS